MHRDREKEAFSLQRRIGRAICVQRNPEKGNIPLQKVKQSDNLIHIGETKRQPYSYKGNKEAIILKNRKTKR